MTAAPLLRPEAGAAEGADAPVRLRAHHLCLVAVFALYVVLTAPGAGFVFFLAAGSVLAFLVLALFTPISSRAGGQMLARATAAAALLAALVPLAGMVAEGRPLPAAIAESRVWPQILVTLFAGRLLAELADRRFAEFWRSPLGAGRARTQSALAALATGTSLTLVFYQLLGGMAVAPERLDPWAITLRAFAGQTAIHASIVLLFFVVVAAILDAALVSIGDGAALDALRRLCRDRQSSGSPMRRQDLPALVAQRLPHIVHARSLQRVLSAAGAPSGRGSIEAFHLASRRLIQTLISFLPLLGFLGTVIGLTAAIGGLPASLGPQAAQNLDIGASLLGLAVKFETTLLGLLGALIASLLLALLDRREAEVAAAATRLTEALAGDD